MSFWAPAYFFDQRRQEDLERVNLIFGGITAVAGLVATLLGGWLADRFAKRSTGAYFHVSAGGMLLAFPSTLAMLYAPFPQAWVLCFLAVFFSFFQRWPGEHRDCESDQPRGKGDGLCRGDLHYACLRRRGFAAADWGCGRPLEPGGWFLVVSFVMLVAGVLWLAGARFLGPDAERAGRQ
jgi:MFS transporter, Spinster family, sphingosine-1-phosphate transporter